jgi:hypothetical protein
MEALHSAGLYNPFNNYQDYELSTETDSETEVPSHTTTAAGPCNNILSSSTETPVPYPIPTAPCSVRPLYIILA